ncbi:pectinesterase 3-like [Impatiens glandulifera]|uniref:pectinesterase 3-like n=1 Tax=Impatiens glandulifera TaxID=253017 RepID=UPI001FB058C8|nr:pectinesterase 3-like [Impatiens glandulifera]
MDTIKSFKGYGKVDEVEQQAFRKKTRKRIVIIIASVILLFAIVIAIVVGTLLVHNNKNSTSSGTASTTTTSSSIRSVCSVTQYQESCISSLRSLDTTTTTDPQQLFKLSLLAVLTELTHLSTFPSNLKSKINDDRVRAALGVCQVVIDDAIDRINDSISAMGDDDDKSSSSLSIGMVEDLKTWLSTTLTDQETCFDSLEEVNAITVLEEMKVLARNSTEFSSNSLAIVSKILGILSNFNSHHRRLLLLGQEEGLEEEEEEDHHMRFPRWVERRFLQETKPTPNVVVNKDGTGDYRTIGEAVAKIPKKSATRFVIYVKAGEYVENVNLDKSLWNVMMYGDGMANTIVSGSLNKIDGTPTFNTATFAVVGKGFIARDMGFKNSAGPQKEQAVALRSGSDQSVFYKCSFDGFQDTLYAHSNRQFYRECDITGTVDFIFGNSAVVLQSCNIQPRQPGPNQVVTITAQGKKDVNQNTGISIQKCSISPLMTSSNSSSLTARSYLGRPWKEYSTTIIMQSQIGSFLDPAGWSPWVPGVNPPSTIFYAEYLNTGPGATLDKRVTWDGYTRNTTSAQASKFTVESFIDGTMWLPQTQVLFDLTL